MLRHIKGLKNLNNLNKLSEVNVISRVNIINIQSRNAHTLEYKNKEIEIIPQIESSKKKGINLLKEIKNKLASRLDPKGWRRQLISRNNNHSYNNKNNNGVKSGDIVFVKMEKERAFIGTVLGIYRKDLGTSVLVRTHVAKVATEIIVQLFSPKLNRFVIIRKAANKPRRSKLYYLRQPSKDPGTVDKLIEPHILDTLKSNKDILTTKDLKTGRKKTQKEKLQQLKISIKAKTSTRVGKVLRAMKYKDELKKDKSHKAKRLAKKNKAKHVKGGKR